MKKKRTFIQTRWIVDNLTWKPSEHLLQLAEMLREEKLPTSPNANVIRLNLILEDKKTGPRDRRLLNHLNLPPHQLQQLPLTVAGNYIAFAFNSGSLDVGIGVVYSGFTFVFGDFDFGFFLLFDFLGLNLLLGLRPSDRAGGLRLLLPDSFLLGKFRVG